MIELLMVPENLKVNYYDLVGHMKLKLGTNTRLGNQYLKNFYNEKINTPFNFIISLFKRR